MSGSRRGLPPAQEFAAQRALVETGGGDRAAGAIPAQQLDAIGDRILRVAERRNQREDQAAQQDALDAGAAAGEAAPGTMMEGGGQLAQQAFNRAALEAGGRRLEITARTEYERLAREHAADPAAFAAAATAWRDGTLSTVPEAFRVRVAPQLDILAQPFMRVIRDQSDRAVADERGASFTQALPLRLAAIERAGLRAATDPAARTEADREQVGLRGELVAMGPRHAFVFEGVQYPADPTRAGRFTLEQMADIRRRAQDTEAVAVARSAFRTGPQTLAAVEAFERQAEAGEIPGLRPDQARDVAAALRRDIAQDRAAATEGQREARTALAPRLDADRAAIAERGEPVSNVLDTELAAAGYDVAQYRAQERARMQGWQARQDLAGIDTPQRAQEIADRFAPGTPAFAADPQTAQQVLQLARERGATVARAALDGTLRDRSAELSTNSAAAVRHAASLPADWRPHVEAGAQAAGLPPFLLAALVGRESGGRAGAVSPAGARGPAQIMPATAANPGFGMEPISPADVMDPAKAIPWAAQYYRRLLDAFGGNHQHALMAYNWGPGNVQQWIRGGSTGPVPAETRAYVAALLPAVGGDPSRAGWTPPPIMSAEEGRQAGLTPEQIARASSEAAEAARQAALRMRAMTATPAERTEIEAELAVSGDRAAENARLMAAWQEVLTQRARGMADDPAGYVAQASPVLQQLQQQVAAGDMAALPALVDGLRREQARQGVPERQQRALPDGLVAGLFSQIADGNNPTTADQTLRAVVTAAGPEGTARMFQEANLPGGAASERRQAIIAAAALMGTNQPAASRILRGAFVLRDNTMPGQTTALMEARLDAHAGASFAGPGGSQVRSQVAAAARAYYAAGLSDTGKLASSTFDPTRFNEALATIMPVARYGGQRVPLPANMTERRFLDTMAALPPDRLAGAIAADGSPITPAMVARGGFSLMPVAPGRYMLRWGQYEVLDRNAGDRRPFVLDLTGAAPAQAMGPPSDRVARDSPARAVRPVEEPADMLPEPLGPPGQSAARLRWEGGTSQISNAPIGSRILGRTP
jgi:soluble lytic murein transglycosylase-like protein